MRLFLPRHRLRLLMPFERQPSPSSSATAHLKRSYAQQAYAVDESAEASHHGRPSSSSRARGFGFRSDNPTQRPAKVARLEDPMPQQSHKSSLGRTVHHPGGGSSGSFRSSGSSRAFGKRRDDRRGHKPTITAPLYTRTYIKETYQTKPVKQAWEENAKSVIVNWCSARDIQFRPESSKEFDPDGQPIMRTKLTIECEGETFVTYGDDAKQKVAERLACLYALYLLDGKDMMQPPKKLKPELSAVEETLSDGSVVEYERARQFMDYYCRRFGFGKPDFDFSERRNVWEAVMTVGGRRIGMGSGTNKKVATQACYVDVTKYLESCDPELWQKFVEDAKSGKDLGLAPPVVLQLDERLEDQIQNLCGDIKRSSIYKNRPRLASLMTGEDDPATMEETQAPVALYVPPSRRKATEAFLTEKSRKLQERRQQYLQDPNMEKMRSTRATLPVYTKAEALLDHIKNNDVTICMAATGSGKTTQIPQLILDEWIDQGRGAKCNIICTQPRRLAAISVANRVAAERGEKTGESIGYQVRFEAQLPKSHGSVTFCTTGIFLKRMQNDLLQTEQQHRAMDEVTHILVDEVHERDVDTDLLLVVLKRLLADRKARGKPIKVVLMSATIDPKLFQEYFPDSEGKPASVTEIPGRSYPVQKQFLDEFISAVAVSAHPSAKWVLSDKKVQDYLNTELDPPSLLALYEATGSQRPSLQTSKRDDETEVPWPLIALIVTHVLRNSEDGHVLVFLPGWEDIAGVQKALLETSMGLNFKSDKYSIHCLHSSIPLLEQQAIFEPPPAGQRRVILSTNIAETSVTIPDVVYVVDTGRIKEKRYNPEKRISSLVSAPVGKSNLNQRAGRAGRHRPGEYYGLLTRTSADALETHQTVEMKRVDLSNVVMHVKALNFPGMTVEEVLEETIEPPSIERVHAAVTSLQMVGALDSNKHLTSLGRVLLQLPLDVQMGRLVLYGCFFRCLDSALTLAALLTGREIFLSPMHLKNESFARKNSFSPESFRSDALAMLEAYDTWWEKQSRGLYVSANSFCVANFLAKPTMLQVHSVKTQILQILSDIGVIEVCAGGVLASEAPRASYRQVPPELNENAKNLPVLAALISIALQPNFAVRTGEKTLRTARDKMVFIHPNSVNNRKRMDLGQVHEEKELIAFSEKRQNLSLVQKGPPNINLVTTTRLDPLTYILFGAYHLEVTRRGLECDGWLPIIGNLDALDDLERLKVLMESCMLRVFEGIIEAQSKRRGGNRPMRRDEDEDESGDEDDMYGPSALTKTEIQELDLMTRDIARILSDYDHYRIANQSRHNSLPGTPTASPGWRPGRLPPMGGTRSGYTTPQYGSSGLFHSRPNTPRPNTPSRLR